MFLLVREFFWSSLKFWSKKHSSFVIIPKVENFEGVFKVQVEKVNEIF